MPGRMTRSRPADGGFLTIEILPDDTESRPAGRAFGSEPAANPGAAAEPDAAATDPASDPEEG